MRILGIDYGSKRVGLALGDTESRIASPLMVVPNDGAAQLFTRLRDLFAQEQIKHVVVGVPLSLRQPGEENDQLREVRHFINGLAELGVEIFEENEMMSSGLAARQVQETGKKGKRDDLAAAVILQSWLDRKHVSP
jgi:putative Holliday junction resolvase